MRNIFLSFTLMMTFFAFSVHGDNSPRAPQDYLTNRLDPNDQRYKTFLKALELLEQRNALMLVETGTARDGDKNFAGDGGSTIIFGDWAKQNGALLYTVDITPAAIEGSKSATKEYADNIEYVCGDSVTFLENFQGPIDFLYLDSYDFDFSNPAPSQEHHLKEIIAAYPHLHENSIVMIDDCGLPKGGKGKLVIKYLLSRGWFIKQKNYQVIMLNRASVTKK